MAADFEEPAGDSSEEELDPDEKKLLNKRRKRQLKIEDCAIDLDGFIRQQKRQRLDAEEDTTASEGIEGE